MGVSSEREHACALNGEVDRLNAGVLIMRTASAIERGEEQPHYFSVPEDLQTITGTSTLPVVQVHLSPPEQERLRRVMDEDWGAKATSEDVTFLQGSAGHINLIAVGYNGRIEKDATVYVPYSPSSRENAIEGAPTTLERIGTVFMAMSHR